MTKGRVIASVLVALVVAGVWVLHAMGLLHRPVAIARQGDRFPVFAVQTTDDRSLTLGAGPSHGIVVYNVFTSWCPACKEELPDVRQAAAELHDVRFVGIDQGEPPALVAAFAARAQLPFPVVVDTSSATNRLLGARMIPETLIVRDGVIKRVIVGPTTRESLISAVRGV